MDKPPSRRDLKRRGSVSGITKLLLLASDHRHVVLVAGVLLVLAAVWAGTSIGTSKVDETFEDGTFSELEGFDSPGRNVAQIEEPPPLVLPPPPASEQEPIDLGPAFAAARYESPAVNAAHFVSPSAEMPLQSPAWLTGTIEVDDGPAELPGPVLENPQRYTRAVQR